MDLGHVLDIDAGSLVSDRAAMAAAFASARASGSPIVLHFHGGLVSRSSALDGAPELCAFYEAAGAYPIIPVWNTGPVAVLEDIWVRLAQEALFRILVDRVTGLVHARMSSFIGTRGPDVNRTLGPIDGAAFGAGDFTPEFLGLNLDAVRGDAELMLREFQEESIKTQIQTDAELNTIVDAVLRGAGLPVAEGARAAGVPVANEAVPSLADPEALRGLQGDANARGLGIGTALAILKIAGNVIARFVQSTDHGLHATVVEEVLREFYLGAVGTAAWSKMKEYTRLAFAPATPTAAGTALIEELSQVPPAQRVLLAGHSAGSIFIAELLRHFPDALRQFEVAFLAPALTVQLFTEAIVRRAHVLAKCANGDPQFRMYSMSDEYESRDVLVRGVPLLGDLNWFYPRSLLYLISGLLEESNGNAVVGAAITGLQHIYAKDAPPEVVEARQFLQASPSRCVWAIAVSADPRLQSNSTSHGGFATPGPANTSMSSVAALLAAGWQ